MCPKSRIIAILLVLALCIPAGSALAAYVKEHGTLHYVSNPSPSDRLNLRTEPKSSAPSLGRYYNGVAVYTLTAPQNNWVLVQIDGSDVMGYMDDRYLSQNPVPSAIPLAEVRNREGTGLNLRADRSTTSRSIAFYGNGTLVEVLGYGASWHHVRVGGVTGYMVAGKLSLNPTSTPVQVPSANTAIGYAIVSNPDPKDRLNLRNRVDTSGRGGESLGKYYSGVQVEILEHITRGNISWAKVRIGARTGYMQTQFLAIDALPYEVPSHMPTVEVSNARATQQLNLRQSPSTNAKSLGSYRNGTKVVVLGVISDDWVHVRVDGVEGFMMSAYLYPRLWFDQ